MMSIDAPTAIENFASGIFSAGMEFLFTGRAAGDYRPDWSSDAPGQEGRHSMGPGKFIAGIVICGMLVALPSLHQCRGYQMGFRADSFGPIAAMYNQPPLVPLCRCRQCHFSPLVKLAGVGLP